MPSKRDRADVALRRLHPLHRLFCLARYAADDGPPNRRQTFCPSTGRRLTYMLQASVCASLLVASATYKFVRIDKIDFASSGTWYSNYYYLSTSALDVSVSLAYIVLSCTRERRMCAVSNAVRAYDGMLAWVNVQLAVLCVTVPTLAALSVRAGSPLDAIAPIVISVGPFARDCLALTQFGNAAAALARRYSAARTATFRTRLAEHRAAGVHAVRLDDVYGTHAAFSVILRVCWLVSNGYDVAMIATGNAKYSGVTLEQNYVYLPWLAVDVAMLLLIIAVADGVRLEAAESATELASYSRTARRNLTEYNIWILKVLDEEVQLTADGLFKLDYTFIISSVGTLVYFIFILTQLERDASPLRPTSTMG